ncbi:hypothetical protein R5R35_001495 [Gryllus longicercus]|uniref:NAD-dependent protein deacetylase n=1 Tax=Gryllus longicercus TaxID=2509291 RepID=A0AAN9VZD2_9ORTH
MWCWKKKSPLISEKSLPSVAEYILSEQCTKIVTMAGAGISTAAGIPDFRSPSSGLYAQLAALRLPYPEAVFDFDYFTQNPVPFFRICKEMYPKLKVKPTLTHYFIKLLDDKGLLLRHYTQNIDGLERKAGLCEDKLIQAHGTYETGHCLKCNKGYSLKWMETYVMSDTIPMCIACGALVKPDIILFGEGIPQRVVSKCRSDFRSCDLLLILGSSLTVEPIASFAGLVKKKCPRVLINRTPVQKRGFRFQNSDSRDIAWYGNSDEGCSTLALYLGWEKDLVKLMGNKK